MAQQGTEATYLKSQGSASASRAVASNFLDSKNTSPLSFLWIQKLNSLQCLPPCRGVGGMARLGRDCTYAYLLIPCKTLQTIWWHPRVPRHSTMAENHWSRLTFLAYTWTPSMLYMGTINFACEGQEVGLGPTEVPPDPRIYDSMDFGRNKGASKRHETCYLHVSHLGSTVQSQGFRSRTIKKQGCNVVAVVMD